ncbi:hypothetical protein ACROYT_G014040 [Oculina patagonica]
MTVLKENEVPITNKKQIAELMNNHFVKVAENADDVKASDFGEDFVNHPSILAIRNAQRHAPEQFSFHHTNMVEEMLKDMNTLKTCGHDMLTPRLIKDSASVTARPLTVLFNCSIDQSTYPASWKMGQITPIFKKDDELKVQAALIGNFTVVKLPCCALGMEKDERSRGHCGKPVVPAKWNVGQ